MSQISPTYNRLSPNTTKAIIQQPRTTHPHIGSSPLLLLLRLPRSSGFSGVLLLLLLEPGEVEPLRRAPGQPGPSELPLPEGGLPLVFPGRSHLLLLPGFARSELPAWGHILLVARKVHVEVRY